MAVSGLGVTYSVAGFVLLWSGYKNATIKDTLTSFLKGQEPTANPTGSPTIGVAEDSSSSDGTGSGSSGSGSAAPGNTGADSATAAANQAIGKLLAAAYGWATGTQWSDLVSLWNQESGWNNTAQNPTSGAYGIAQALPYSKMPQSAWPPADGGSASATAQISWGLSYIKSTYGSPSAAWAHEVADGWY